MSTLNNNDLNSFLIIKYYSLIYLIIDYLKLYYLKHFKFMVVKINFILIFRKINLTILM